MAGYTKLFSDIVDSSIWDQDSDTCKVWITLLALSNQYGYVRGSISWLAHKAKVDVNKCQQAVNAFLNPDPVSRNPDNEGRRIIEENRGWRILNYEEFRARDGLSEDPRRIYQREWMKSKRDREKSSTSQQGVNISVNSVNECQRVSTPASASESVHSVPKEGGVGEGNRRTFAKPTLDEVKLLGAKIGLMEDQCCHFYDYYESNGWKVGRNPMRSVPHAMANWKRNAQSYGSNGHSGARTPNDLRLIIEAKQKACDDLKAKHCCEGPLGNTWGDEQARGQHGKLRKEIKELREKMAGMA